MEHWSVERQEKFRARYLRDPLPVQLGNLASAFSRAGHYLADGAFDSAANAVLNEARYLAEWILPEAPPEIQGTLRDTQQIIARWCSVAELGQLTPGIRIEANRRAEELLRLGGHI